MSKKSVSIHRGNFVKGGKSETAPTTHVFDVHDLDELLEVRRAFHALMGLLAEADDEEGGVYELIHPHVTQFNAILDRLQAAFSPNREGGAA